MKTALFILIGSVLLVQQAWTIAIIRDLNDNYYQEADDIGPAFQTEWEPPIINFFRTGLKTGSPVATVNGGAASMGTNLQHSLSDIMAKKFAILKENMEANKAANSIWNNKLKYSDVRHDDFSK